MMVVMDVCFTQSLVSQLSSDAEPVSALELALGVAACRCRRLKQSKQRFPSSTEVTRKTVLGCASPNCQPQLARSGCCGLTECSFGAGCAFKLSTKSSPSTGNRGPPKVTLDSRSSSVEGCGSHEVVIEDLLMAAPGGHDRRHLLDVLTRQSIQLDVAHGLDEHP